MDDLTAVQQLEAEASPFWTPTQLREEFENERRQVFVLEADQRISGYMIYRALPDALELLNIRVAQEKQGMGYGKALLAHLVDQARIRACAVICLEVALGNAPALGLYRRFGFREVGRRANYYRDGGDAVLMDMMLER